MLPDVTSEVVADLEREIHVWTTELDLAPGAIRHFERLLPPGEMQRIAKFKTPELRSRHTVVKGTLLSLIAQYTGDDAENIELGTTELGKPYLLHDDGDRNLQFNVADSNDLAIYAITKGGPIGVDLEEVIPLPDWQIMADVCMNAFEGEWIFSLPRDRQEMAFLRLWTIKEAYLKAIGTGLSVAPSTIEVEFIQGEQYKFRRIHNQHDSIRNWKIFSFCPRPTFVAALVVPASSRELRCFCCQPERRN